MRWGWTGDGFIILSGARNVMDGGTFDVEVCT